MVATEINYRTETFTITDKLVDNDINFNWEFVGILYNFALTRISSKPIFDDGNFTEHTFQMTLAYEAGEVLDQGITLNSKFIETTESNGDLLTHGTITQTRAVMDGFLVVPLNESDNDITRKYIFFLIARGTDGGSAERSVVSKRIQTEIGGVSTEELLIDDLNDASPTGGGQNPYVSTTNKTTSYDVITAYVPEG